MTMSNWRAMSGEKNWEGLLDPLDDVLRKYMIHYGEMAQATYDAYDSDESSNTGGNSKYPMNHLFSDVGLAKGRARKNYTVTKYLYATSSIPLMDRDTNWMGYVAVSTDEGKREMGRRDIVVAWRGTSEEIEWISDARFFLQPAPKIFGDQDDKLEVHRGFYLLYTSDNPMSTFNKTSARDQVLEEVTRLVNEYKHEEISVTVTGHSLGAALATLNAIDIAKNVCQGSSAALVTAFVFASPRVGNSEVRDLAASIGNLRVLRIENKPDVVPDVPNVGYADVGQVLMMDTRKSTFLKHNLFDFFSSVGMAHNLEVYLHGISGTQGIGRDAKFKEKVERDLPLVNKYNDYLKDKYGVPSSWWNKVDKAGLVQQPDGSWKLVKINNKPAIIFSRL